ncbi:hypothetical protein CASFOL_007187 [Castilleja foliolosa]|uniref:Uncharacterized protein n=1 Tax=Castilleja foliolosa TaxID=1961234 RepID=A0ABD3ECC5_9LAMI
MWRNGHAGRVVSGYEFALFNIVSRFHECGKGNGCTVFKYHNLDQDFQEEPYN